MVLEEADLKLADVVTDVDVVADVAVGVGKMKSKNLARSKRIQVESWARLHCKCSNL